MDRSIKPSLLIPGCKESLSDSTGVALAASFAYGAVVCVLETHCASTAAVVTGALLGDNDRDNRSSSVTMGMTHASQSHTRLYWTHKLLPPPTPCALRCKCPQPSETSSSSRSTHPAPLIHRKSHISQERLLLWEDGIIISSIGTTASRRSSRGRGRRQQRQAPAAVHRCAGAAGGLSRACQDFARARRRRAGGVCEHACSRKAVSTRLGSNEDQLWLGDLVLP